MEIFKPNNSILTDPEIDRLPLDQILPDAAGLSAPVGEGSPSPLPGQLPVLAETDTGDVLFAGHIQGAIAPHIDPPSLPQPPSPGPADPLIGNSAAVNQEAIASLGRPGNGVKVEYFDNADFTNRVLTRIVPNINENWGDGSPDEAIAPDSFSANWTGKLLPEFTETYTFWTESDDRTTLELAGEPVFTNGESSGATNTRGAIALSAGQLYDFTFAYSHDRGDAGVDLWWSSPSQAPEIIPLSALHTSETRLEPEPELHPLRFFTEMFYNPGEAVQFRGKVYTGDRDTEKIDFRLQKDGGEWVDISDATQLEPASDDPDYAFFNYELSDLEPGRYHLQGIVLDDPLTDSTFTESFTILDLPTETALPDTVVNAIARSADLENYSAEELAGTREWVVNLRVGEESSELATALGARDLGPTGHIPNSFMWEFSADVKAMDAVSQLEGLPAVQFFYPLISVKLESLTPKDPLFVKQWHLDNTGQTGGKPGVDANVTDAWDEATGRGVAIAIVDDGLEHTHPDLIGNYRADLSRDFNEGDIETRNYDRDPTPFSQGLTFKAQMENGVGLEEEIPSQYVDFEGTVASLKLTLDIDHPSPENLEVYLYSPNDNELELRPGENSNEFTIAAAELEDLSSLGEWELVIENDTSIPGILHDWWLTLDVWNSHGTAVAGVAGASGNNDLGVTGVAPDADLAGLRLIAAQRVEDFQIADALYSELNQDIDIYNNSWKAPIFWAGPESMMALHQGATEGRDGLGNIYVFGAGNNGTLGEDLNYNAFANSPHTIAVGAIDHFGKKSPYSQPGSSLLVTAPSSNNRVGITTTDLMGGEGRNVNGNGKYGPNLPDLDYTNDFGGTSSASPVVSGVNALMLEVNPNLTPRDVQHILVETANRDLINDRRAKWTGSDGDAIRHNYKYGFGVVDAEAAVNAAGSWTPVAEEVSFSTGTLTSDRLIPDGNPFGVTERIKMEQEMKLEWVEVVLDVSHELRSDLKVELTSPSGTKSLLAFPWIEFPESNAGYDNWEFTTVRHWNESSLGEWKLRVVDPPFGFSDEAGTWNSWELKFYGTPPTTVEVEATDPIASEDGEEGEFTFTRTGSVDHPVTVNYSLSGTATEGVDYQTLGTVVIPAGEERAIVRIIPSDDAEVEGNETVVVNLVDDVSYAIGTNDSATVTIADNDIVNNPPTLTQTPIEVLTGATEGKSFTISYSELMEQLDATDGDGDPIAFEISTIASGRLMKNDVPVEPGVTTLSEGEAVVWTPDNAGNEITAFTVRAFDGTDHSAAVPVKVAVAVTPLPVVTISATDANASEDGDAGEFTVTRSGDTTESLSVSFSTAGDATAGSDYSTIGEIVFPAGSSEVKVSLDPIDDGEIEGSETVVLNLEAGTGYKLGDESSAEVSIADNERQNSLADLKIAALSNPTTVAPNGALTYTLFAINSGSAAATDIEISNTLPVEFSLVNVTSQGNFVADTSTPGIVSFAGGSLGSGAFAILTISGNVSPDAVGSLANAVVVDPDNQIAESDETNNTATTIVTVKAIAPVVTISATDANASEDGDAGEFTVTRSGATTESLSVSYSTAGDATAGSDYSTIGEIVIPAGSSEVTVAIAPIDDDEVEEEETLVVNLEAGTGYKLGDESSASVSIADNDVGPFVMEVGRPDNFDRTDGQEGENPLTTEPGEPRPFDGDGLNQSFTHRFDLSEALAAGEIISATFETKIKRIAGANDIIEFGNFSDPENLPAWGSYIGKGGVATTWLDDGWTTGEAIEFNFDMSALSAFDVNTDAPTRSRNLLPMMNNLGFLDVTIEDDSMVDYVRLTVEVTPTEGPLPYVVTNTNDSGAGSLRSAIAWANSNPGRDTILFDIPDDGPHTISPTSVLPNITEAVVIDGWSQNGGTPSSTPLIELSGSNAGAYGKGLRITGSNVEVRGLAINNWQQYGIEITGASATDNWIYGNFIGTNTEGTAAIANDFGIIISNSNDTSNNIIGTNGDGTADAAEANLISGNGSAGIFIRSNSNIVAGNRIGTNKDGTAAIANQSFGVLIASGINNIIGTNGDGTADAAEWNLISGNGSAGVGISSNYNAVAGNQIGTNKDGTAAIANKGSGVFINGDSTNNIIGTNGDGIADADEGNLISGNNSSAGVSITGNYNTVAGNRIGTNKDGTAAIANEWGVSISSDANNNIIGTNGDGIADAVEANLISGNSNYGVLMLSGGSNLVAGNLGSDKHVVI